MLYFAIQIRAGGKITFLQYVINHPLQTHRASVIGVINSCDAVLLKIIYLFGQNSSSTSTKDLNVSAASFFQKIVHVFEIFVVPALITCDSDRVRIFLYSAVNNFLHASVVTQMYDLCPRT